MSNLGGGNIQQELFCVKKLKFVHNSPLYGRMRQWRGQCVAYAHASVISAYTQAPLSCSGWSETWSIFN